MGEQIMAIERLVGYFGAVADSRRRKVEHPLTDILVIAVCAVIACAESWNDIARYGRSKLTWLRTFLELTNGIPSHDTFRRVFMLIDPDAFEDCFARWASAPRCACRRSETRSPNASWKRSRSQSPRPCSASRLAPARIVGVARGDRARA